MKKILTALLAAAMLVVAPATLFAEQEDPNQELETPSSGSIELFATVASSYTLKLPKKVDVSELSTEIKIYAKGDVDAGKKIMVKEKDETGGHSLVDKASKKQAKALTVTAGGGINGGDVGASYNDEKYTTLTVVHGNLDAAEWTCNLPIVISLDNIAA
ncbi:MAG: hypothetical protein Q4E99_06230 [Bacillota bacterium]|nr:hypothetical protein [Bacillota bacterium]